jgi:ATP-dependent Clp protease adaptor protein ClpS
MVTRKQRDGGAVLEPEKSRVKPPPLFRVLLLNDDYTPMDFFPHDVAATKVEQVSAFAQQHQHPLACVMEEN